MDTGGELLNPPRYYSTDGDASSAFPISFGDRVQVSEGYTVGSVEVPAGIYVYLGGESDTIAPSTADYTNLDLWKLESSASGLVPNLGNVTGSDSIAIGGAVVRNVVESGAVALLEGATIDSGTLTIDAQALSTLIAELDSFAESSGGSSFGTGTSLAVNGSIATNVVVGAARAEIIDSNVTTTGAVPTVAHDASSLSSDLVTSDLVQSGTRYFRYLGSGETGVDLSQEDFRDVSRWEEVAAGTSVRALNDASIEALNKSATVSGDTAVGVSLAFNTVGYAPTNLLFASVDALVGTSLTPSSDAEAIARITGTSSVTSSGGIAVEAQNTATIDADLSNDATSAASALVNASGIAASAVLALNRVAGGALAEIVANSATGGDGAVVVSADDNGLILASSLMKAISSTSNDGGASLAGTFIDQLEDSYQYSSASVGQVISQYDVVRVASTYANGGVPGGVYQYTGATDLALSGTTDYSDTGNWQRVREASVSDLIPTGLNVTASESVAVGGLVVRNELAGGATARINQGTVSGGSVTVDAQSRTQLDATSEGIVESSGGSAFGTGVSLAINAMI
ncbi:MAG: hypothetical protein DCO98_12050, partial [Altererythrobacter sp. XM-24bin4]